MSRQPVGVQSAALNGQQVGSSVECSALIHFCTSHLGLQFLCAVIHEEILVVQEASKK